MSALYRVGDIVLLKDSCEVDIGTYAWNYVKNNRMAKIVSCKAQGKRIMYGLEWADEFEGGHDCWRTCAPHRGQFVHEPHLELLNFEASREVNTVPNIEGYDDEDA